MLFFATSLLYARGTYHNYAPIYLSNKIYIITNEGLIYLANKDLKEVGKLRSNLENGFVVIDRENGELFYVLKSDFNKNEKTMRMLLNDATKIKL